MASKPKSSVANHRARKARQGFVRVEVNVRKEDAGLVRLAASALSDPSRQAEARQLLRRGLHDKPIESVTITATDEANHANGEA